LLVQDSVYEVFAQKLAAAVKKLKPAFGLEAGATQGPLIDNAAVEKVESHIAMRKRKGRSACWGAPARARRKIFRAYHLGGRNTRDGSCA